MAFVTDKEVLKSGLIIFRRGDVGHGNWYCRIKLPRADRYKTISLKTSNKEAAKEEAFDQERDVRVKVKNDIAVFNRPFSQVAKEYADLQDERVKLGDITQKRTDLVRSTIDNQLNRYVGTAQVHLIGPERWTAYPAWRRNAGQGVIARIGSTRPFTKEEQEAEDTRVAAIEERQRIDAERAALLGRTYKPAEIKRRKEWVIVSDETIKTEMSIFRAVMTYAISKRYVTAEHAFGKRPSNLEDMRRDEFTAAEYKVLHSKGRAWVRRANDDRPSSVWTRTIVYNFVLIMCNTGMRPPEAKNLRWRDITTATDREGAEIVVIWVRGKGKQRYLVAPKSVGDYFQRMREVTENLRPHVPITPDQAVFTSYTGEPSLTLYDYLIKELLDFAGLEFGPTGAPRGAYCFRHTYATFRLSAGVGAYSLAEQMGTSVQMLEKNYGHVNNIRHANLVLQGMPVFDAAHAAEPVPEAATDVGGERAAANSKRRQQRADHKAEAEARKAHKAKAATKAATPTRRRKSKPRQR